MDQPQNATKPNPQYEADVVPIPFTELSPSQQDWVDYNVVQGTSIEADGTMRKVTVQEFADAHNVDRTTCYRWQKIIPNFWDLVDDRRKVIFTGARTAKVWNALFLTATIKLNTTAQAIWLANADKSFKMPAQKIEHEAGTGLADLLQKARERRQSLNRNNPQVIEAEVTTKEPNATNDQSTIIN